MSRIDEIGAAFAVELASRSCFVDTMVMSEIGPVRHRFFLGDADFPAELVQSARAIVFRGSKVVVVKDRVVIRERKGAGHILPGGHLEDGETEEEALRRELLEETGWRVGEIDPFGFIFIEPAGAQSEAVMRRVHTLFLAEGISCHRSARDLSQIEIGSRLVPMSRALADLPDDLAKLLEAAIHRRRRRSVLPAPRLSRLSPG
ncbi:MAG: NUDIX domain-containing protein [Caulobacteraceae bacterium]